MILGPGANIINLQLNTGELGCGSNSVLSFFLDLTLTLTRIHAYTHTHTHKHTNEQLERHNNNSQNSNSNNNDNTTYSSVLYSLIYIHTQQTQQQSCSADHPQRSP